MKVKQPIKKVFLSKSIIVAITTILLTGIISWSSWLTISTLKGEERGAVLMSYKKTSEEEIKEDKLRVMGKLEQIKEEHNKQVDELRKDMNKNYMDLTLMIQNNNTQIFSMLLEIQKQIKLTQHSKE